MLSAAEEGVDLATISWELDREGVKAFLPLLRAATRSVEAKFVIATS